MTTPEEIILTFAGFGGVSAGAGGLALAMAVRHAAKTFQSAIYRDYSAAWSVQVGPPKLATTARASAATVPGPAGATAATAPAGRSPMARDNWKGRPRNGHGQFLPADPGGQQLRDAS